MIAIVSSSNRERTAIVRLCQTRDWSHRECDSLNAFARLVGKSSPKAVVVRHTLADGFSDDALARLNRRSLLPATRVIVLLGTGELSSVECRQLAAGADCVLRDPLRSEVLLAYLEKYLRGSKTSVAPPASEPIQFAGGTLDPLTRKFHHGSRTVVLTPREASLAEMLAAANGQVVTYDTLYTEILGRAYRSDTSNMRVLLGKLVMSAARVGISLRRSVAVIAKTGYHYQLKTPNAESAGQRPGYSGRIRA